MNHAQFWGGAAAPYEIEQSLRFNSADSAHLSRTPSSAGNRETWTFSCWVKVGSLSQGERGTIFQSNGGPTIYQDSGLRFAHAWDPPGTDYVRETVAVFRDPSAWYHVVWWCDTAQSGTRWKIYVNGVEQTLQTPSGNNGEPAQDADLGINSTNEHTIGEFASYSYLDGYLAEAHFIDGSALGPTNFGEYDDNGVWRPKRYTGSYGTNGFYLKFDPTATNGIGHDHSGNGNNWTASGFTTSGTGTDVMSDTPTTNYCTWNPVSKAYWQPSFTEGNLKISGGAAPNAAVGTIGVSSGKWYWEALNVYGGSGNNDGYVGIAGDNHSFTSNGAETLPATIFYYRDGRKRIDGTFSSYGASVGNTDVIGVALDIDGGTITFYKNNTSQGSITLSSSTLNGKTIFPYCVRESGSVEINCGQHDFTYTPPTGFKALNTSNLPAPTVKDGSDYFNTVTYTGNTSTQSITGVGFQPDFVWAKDRTNANEHALFNVITGAGNRLSSNLTAAEINDNTTLTSFDTDGFSLGSDGSGIINRSTRNYVAWNWLAGNGTSSNTDGSITSTVSANPSAGFSIVSYTGTGANATVGHGLGVAPRMVITKSRDGGSWGVYHASVGANYILYLNLSDAAFSNVYAWNNTAPTSTVFTVSQSDACNTLNEDYIAYCFAEVEGYSKFGSYRGTNAADGPFIYCGFAPKWVLIKNTGQTWGWVMLDGVRNSYNLADDYLLANAADSEVSDASRAVDFLSNGFKIRGDSSFHNSSSYDMIFAAFAEHPFGGSGVTPATAR